MTLHSDIFIMASSCNSTEWHLAVTPRCDTKQYSDISLWHFAVTLCSDTLQWQISVTLCSGALQWHLTVTPHCNTLQWHFAVTNSLTASFKDPSCTSIPSQICHSESSLMTSLSRIWQSPSNSRWRAQHTLALVTTILHTHQINESNRAVGSYKNEAHAILT